MSNCSTEMQKISNFKMSQHGDYKALQVKIFFATVEAAVVHFADFKWSFAGL